MAFVTLEDRSSSMELVCFPKTLLKYGAFLITDAVVAVSGLLSVREDEEPKLLADKIAVLVPDADSAGLQNLMQLSSEPTASPGPSPKTPAVSPRPRIISKLYLRAANQEDPMFRRAKAICEIFTGAVPVIYYFSDTKEYKPSGLFLNPTEYILEELKELLGDENVVIR